MITVENAIKIHRNKRFGYIAIRLLLLEAGHDLNAKEDEKYDFVIAVAKGNLRYSKYIRHKTSCSD